MNGPKSSGKTLDLAQECGRYRECLQTIMLLAQCEQDSARDEEAREAFGILAARARAALTRENES